MFLKPTDDLSMEEEADRLAEQGESSTEAKTSEGVTEDGNETMTMSLIMNKVVNLKMVTVVTRGFDTSLCTCTYTEQSTAQLFILCISRVHYYINQ